MVCVAKDHAFAHKDSRGRAASNVLASMNATVVVFVRMAPAHAIQVTLALPVKVEAGTLLIVPLVTRARIVQP